MCNDTCWEKTQPKHFLHGTRTLACCARLSEEWEPVYFSVKSKHTRNMLLMIWGRLAQSVARCRESIVTCSLHDRDTLGNIILTRLQSHYCCALCKHGRWTAPRASSQTSVVVPFRNAVRLLLKSWSERWCTILSLTFTAMESRPMGCAWKTSSKRCPGAVITRHSTIKTIPTCSSRTGSYSSSHQKAKSRIFTTAHKSSSTRTALCPVGFYLNHG